MEHYIITSREDAERVAKLIKAGDYITYDNYPIAGSKIMTIANSIDFPDTEQEPKEQEDGKEN